MKRNPINKLAAIAALAAMGYGMLGTGVAAAATWGEDYFPNLPLVTHEGKSVRFYEDLVKDKIVVFNFIYTSCSDICPLMTARLAQVQKRLGDRVGRNIFMYSITLDPAYDSPERLDRHARAFNVGPGWLFLTGKPEDLDLIRHKLGERSRSLSEHRNDLVLGNGKTGEWERASVFDNVDRLVMAIRSMDPEWRARKPGKPVANMQPDTAPVPIGGPPGQALFVKACGSCHTVGRGDLVGPDLDGVFARRERAWLTRFLLAPDVMRIQKDPIALALSARYQGVVMPNLGLSETDVSDLFAYLESQQTTAMDRPRDRGHRSGGEKRQIARALDPGLSDPALTELINELGDY